MTFKVKDPGKYPTNKKPAEVDVYAGGPCSRAPAQNVPGHANMAQPLPPQPHAPPTGFPYGYYPPPYPISGWSGYPPPPPPAPNPTLLGLPTVNQFLKLDYPRIPAWLDYCDRHPDRCSENFSAYADTFNAEGYRRINQLTRDHISVENLSAWLGIGKGTADLLIGYAEEDVELLKAGKFTMTSANEWDFNDPAEQGF